jgi:hypothetical protein
MGHERNRQRASPIDVGIKRCHHVGEQDERQPLENLCDQLVGSPNQQPNDEERVEWNPDQGSNSRDELRGLCHSTEISANVDEVSDDENGTGSPEHPAGIISSNGSCQTAPRNHSQSRAHQLDRGHQRKREERDPERGVTVGCASDRIGGDSRRIIVGRAGDQPRAQDGKGPLQKVLSFANFDISGRQVVSRCHICRKQCLQMIGNGNCERSRFDHSKACASPSAYDLPAVYFFAVSLPFFS